MLACAFENENLENFVTVLINTSETEKVVNLSGANIPDELDFYLTTGSSDENCTLKGSVHKNYIVLPAQSVVTLVNGAYREGK